MRTLINLNSNSLNSGPQRASRSCESKKMRNIGHTWATTTAAPATTKTPCDFIRAHWRSIECSCPAWVGQVQMLVQLQEYPQASLWSQKALELFPSHGDLMAGQAQAECRMGNLKKAYASERRGLPTARRIGLSLAGPRRVGGRRQSKEGSPLFRQSPTSDHDWLVPLESALIYCYYAVYSMAQQRGQMTVEKAPMPIIRGTCWDFARRSSVSIRRPSPASTAVWIFVRDTPKRCRTGRA